MMRLTNLGRRRQHRHGGARLSASPPAGGSVSASRSGIVGGGHQHGALEPCSEASSRRTAPHGRCRLPSWWAMATPPGRAPSPSASAMPPTTGDGADDPRAGGRRPRRSAHRRPGRVGVPDRAAADAADLGVRLHAGALAGGQDDDGVGVPVPLPAGPPCGSVGSSGNPTFQDAPRYSARPAHLRGARCSPRRHVGRARAIHADQPEHGEEPEGPHGAEHANPPEMAPVASRITPIAIRHGDVGGASSPGHVDDEVLRPRAPGCVSGSGSATAAPTPTSPRRRSPAPSPLGRITEASPAPHVMVLTTCRSTFPRPARRGWPPRPRR